MHVDSTRLNPDWRIVSFASDVPACFACFGEELILRNNFEGFESGLVMQEGQKCISFVAASEAGNRWEAATATTFGIKFKSCSQESCFIGERRSCDRARGSRSVNLASHYREAHESKPIARMPPNRIPHCHSQVSSRIRINAVSQTNPQRM
jgi:hypothetical protein